MIFILVQNFVLQIHPGKDTAKVASMPKQALPLLFVVVNGVGPFKDRFKGYLLNVHWKMLINYVQCLLF